MAGERSPVRRVAVVAMVGLAGLAAGSPAHAARARSCGNVRIDQTLHRDSHGAFGAFSISATGATCRTARSVAAGYVLDPTAVEKKTAHIHGWACTNRATAPQRVRVTCSRGTRRVRFRDEIPNG